MHVSGEGEKDNMNMKVHLLAYFFEIIKEVLMSAIFLLRQHFCVKIS